MSCQTVIGSLDWTTKTMAQYGRTVIVTAEVRDRDALREWMRHRKSSVRKVADAATRLSEREDGKDALRVNPSTVGHLISGHQKRVSTRRAELIESVLDVPAGSLFMFKLANVAQDESRVA